MPAKAPIYLKPVNSKKGKKCRLRDILSPDMISPPLGDFRHTVHIGRGGERDIFGDMSFLQGKFELLPGKGDSLHNNQSELLRANSTGDASPAETPSPVLKNAISLPTIGSCQALTLPLIPTTVFSLPPEPMEDILGPLSSTKGELTEEVDILQMDALLRSVDVFGSEPPSTFTNVQPKPDVLLHLLENHEKGPLKAVAKANKLNKSEIRCDNPTSFYINGQANIYKVNGSLTGSNGFDKFSGGMGGFQKKICNGNRYLNGNGNCNGYGYFNDDHIFDLKEKLSCVSGDCMDRDSGVEEGRISDCDFELSKEKSTSQDLFTHITGSLLSLELDLGPSILEDVLNVMDKPEAKSRP